MQYYLAPLEGITTNIYRKVYHKYYAPMDKYFTPFLVPHEKKGFSTKEKREILPEYNEGQFLVPQIMSNNAQDCLSTIEKLKAIGYDEANLNFGCPSKTVVSKKRGSGFLAFPDELETFMDHVMEKCDMKISVKTRIGKLDPDEFYRLLEIYNKYNLEELIIHPRLQSDYYKNHPNMDAFAYAVEKAKAPLCYNGDLFSVEDIRKFQKEFPTVENIMLGRGPLKVPTLMKELAGEERDLNLWYDFHMELLDEYDKYLSGQMNVLYKMKEHWYYLFQSLPKDEKAVKAMRKVKHLDEYRLLVKSILC